VNFILFLVRVNFLAVINFYGKIEGLIFNLLSLHVALSWRGTTWLPLLLLCCLLAAGCLGWLRLACLRLPLGSHFLLLIFFHLLFRVVVTVKFKSFTSLTRESAIFIITLHFSN